MPSIINAITIYVPLFQGESERESRPFCEDLCHPRVLVRADAVSGSNPGRATQQFVNKNDLISQENKCAQLGKTKL